MKREYAELNIDAIRPAPGRPARAPGDVSTLAASISRLGLLCPLVVDPQNVLIAGARRLAACRQAGLVQVPVIRVEAPYGSMTALDIQVDLNLCGQPLTEEELNELIGRKKAKARPAGRSWLARWRQRFSRRA
jgi:ParB-like chromosome segregation protein Spo0J